MVVPQSAASEIDVAVVAARPASSVGMIVARVDAGLAGR
jgi:hypothetical protein